VISETDVSVSHILRRQSRPRPPEGRDQRPELGETESLHARSPPPPGGRALLCAEWRARRLVAIKWRILAPHTSPRRFGEHLHAAAVEEERYARVRDALGRVGKRHVALLRGRGLHAPARSFRLVARVLVHEGAHAPQQRAHCVCVGLQLARTEELPLPHLRGRRRGVVVSTFMQRRYGSH